MSIRQLDVRSLAPIVALAGALALGATRAALAEISTEYDAQDWKGFAIEWEGLAFDATFPGFGPGSCLAGPPGPALNFAGGELIARGYDAALSESCAIADAASGPAVSDGQIVAGGMFELEFDPPINGLYVYYGSLAIGSRVTMRLFDEQDAEIGISLGPFGMAPGVLAIGHGVFSSTPVQRVEFTSNENDTVLVGAFTGLAAGQESLGTIEIPGYGGPNGSTVQLDIAVTRATEVYLDAAAQPGGSGASWRDACADAPTAFAIAHRNAAIQNVYIAEGTYLTGEFPDDSLALGADITYLGGFPPGGAGPRDPAAHPTVFSGDIGVPGDSSDNAFHVMIGTGGLMTMDGVTIRDGRARSRGTGRHGGGVHIAAGTSNFVNCRFENNDGELGGAVGCLDFGTNASFVQCTFAGNTADFGGAANLLNGMVFTFDECTFTSNVASYSGGALILQGFDTSAHLTNCEFESNTAVLAGGAALLTGGAGARWSNCTFHMNSVEGDGGAIWAFDANQPFVVAGSVAGGPFGGSGFEVQTCDFEGNSALGNGGAIYANASFGHVIGCRIYDNSANGQGDARTAFGGGAIYAHSASTIEVINCTIAGNHASGSGPLDGGGILLIDGSDGHFTNTILWGNSAANGLLTTEETQLRIDDDKVATVNYSLLEGWTGTLSGIGTSGNDPLLTDLSAGELTMLSGSPAIDAGNNNALSPVLFALDIAGNPRFVDDPSVADTGVGTPPIVDIGAYEGAARAPACPGDLVSSATFQPPPDGTVDAADLAFLLGDWGVNPGSPADIVTSATFAPPPDGVVDAADLAFLLGEWGACE